MLRSIVDIIFQAGSLLLDQVAKLGLAGALIVFWIAMFGLVPFTMYFLLTRPMRRAERSRLFLDVIESAFADGQQIEESLLSLARTRDLSMGVRFYLVAAWLERSPRLGDALEKVPQFLHPQITRMLVAGQKVGDMRKVLPACRQLLNDAVSQTRSALNYLVILTFVITPLSIWILSALQVAIFPKFLEIGVGPDFAPSYVHSPFGLFYNHGPAIVVLQCLILLLLWAGALIYAGGPRVVAWFPILERLHYQVPWRRKRMQRDFSTMLAILLDSGVPEPEAVTLAGDCSVNRIFRQRATRVVDALGQGMKLSQAVQAMDDTGEFGWRLTNAFHGHTGFLKALSGWHDSLDAKAFQQEQAAAHGITTGLVLWTGLFVGTVVISVFMVLISIVDAGVLW